MEIPCPSQPASFFAAVQQAKTESRWVEQQLGHPVVKAFNSIYARSLATLRLPAGGPGRIAISIAGDNQLAKTVVLGPVNQIGFDGVDGGCLDDSWRQQPGTPAYCTDLDTEGIVRALALAQERARARMARDRE
jgi:predicted dinucleotide-binding enzyme